MTKTEKTVQCVDNSGAEGEYHLLDKGVWREIRKVQGDKKGQPYTVPENRIIKLPATFINAELRIFVKINGEEKEITD